MRTVSMLKKAAKSAFRSARILLDKNVILILAFESRNWGDSLSPILIQEISGKTPIIVMQHMYNIKEYPVYSAIGSILETANANNCGHNNLVIWGTGFISCEGRLKVKPKKICAVRGPLTRDLLLKQGWNCPDIYGDPALLYPRLYKPEIQKKHKLGIVPHYIDKKERFLKGFIDNPDILIIDIFEEIHSVVDQICSCERIASSSLHGIIAADAYGIPSTWIKFSDNVTGNGFKFLDYFKSVGRIDKGPLVIREKTSEDDILDAFYKYKLDLNLNELWEACPFKSIHTY